VQVYVGPHSEVASSSQVLALLRTSAYLHTTLFTFKFYSVEHYTFRLQLIA
jgi:hypothetical protein